MAHDGQHRIAPLWSLVYAGILLTSCLGHAPLMTSCLGHAPLMTSCLGHAPWRPVIKAGVLMTSYLIHSSWWPVMKAEPYQINTSWLPVTNVIVLLTLLLINVFWWKETYAGGLLTSHSSHAHLWTTIRERVYMTSYLNPMWPVMCLCILLMLLSHALLWTVSHTASYVSQHIQ